MSPTCQPAAPSSPQPQRIKAVLALTLQVFCVAFVATFDTGTQWLMREGFSRLGHSWGDILTSVAVGILFACTGFVGITGLIGLFAASAAPRMHGVAGLLIGVTSNVATYFFWIRLHPQTWHEGFNDHLTSALSSFSSVSILFGVASLIRAWRLTRNRKRAPTQA